MEFGPTTVCVDLADQMGASKSRNLSVSPRYVLRDRAILGFIDAGNPVGTAEWKMENEKEGSIRPFAEEDNGKGLGEDFDVKQE
jgi:hypothetical protein